MYNDSINSSDIELSELSFRSPAPMLSKSETTNPQCGALSPVQFRRGLPVSYLPTHNLTGNSNHLYSTSIRTEDLQISDSFLPGFTGNERSFPLTSSASSQTCRLYPPLSPPPYQVSI